MGSHKKMNDYLLDNFWFGRADEERRAKRAHTLCNENILTKFLTALRVQSMRIK